MPYREPSPPPVIPTPAQLAEGHGGLKLVVGGMLTKCCVIPWSSISHIEFRPDPGHVLVFTFMKESPSGQISLINLQREEFQSVREWLTKTFLDRKYSHSQGLL